MLDRLWGTILLRPYVFVFLIAYVVIAIVQMGWRRMLAFAVTAYLIAFGSEAVGLRTGIPYGHYEYFSHLTSDRELWVCGVPVMGSLSFIFLTYAGLAMACVVRGDFAQRGPGMRFTSFPSTLRSPAVVLLAPLFATLLDVVIDPVALQGKSWFLGDLYRWETDGAYFGIPLSNFAGWLLVTFLIVAAFQAVDRWLGRVSLGRGGWCSVAIPHNGKASIFPAWVVVRT